MNRERSVEITRRWKKNPSHFCSSASSEDEVIEFVKTLMSDVGILSLTDVKFKIISIY